MSETVRTARPLRRRRARTLRPFRVAIRARKPCFRTRFSLLGWYVRFINSVPAGPKSKPNGHVCFTSCERQPFWKEPLLYQAGAARRTSNRALFRVARFFTCAPRSPGKDLGLSPVRALQNSWEKVKRALEQDLPESLLAPLYPIKLPESESDRRLVLGVSDRSHLPALRGRYADAVRLRIRSIMGRDLRVEFRLSGLPGEGPTFEHFLEGRSNKLALRAARAVAANTAQTGPLFLYGGAGVGKSHLAKAIELEACRNGLAVLSVGKHGFRKEGGAADLLILDLPDETEASWTNRVVLLMRECDQRNSQIVATGRRPLAATKLPETCRMILGSGIQVHMEPPELALRSAFLDREFQESSLDLAPQLRRELVELLSPDFSQLRAAARKLSFLGTNAALPTDSAALRRHLAEFLSVSPGITISPDTILETVADAFGVSSAEILGNSRRGHVTVPRHLAMFLAVALTDLNKSAVARYFRRNDHSTVINAEKNVKRRIDRDPEFARAVADLRNVLAGSTANNPDGL